MNINNKLIINKTITVKVIHWPLENLKKIPALRKKRILCLTKSIMDSQKMTILQSLTTTYITTSGQNQIFLFCLDILSLTKIEKGMKI